MFTIQGEMRKDVSDREKLLVSVHFKILQSKQLILTFTLPSLQPPREAVLGSLFSLEILHIK
jgi:hypothetical protein